jgi:acetyl esterase/lipase
MLAYGEHPDHVANLHLPEGDGPFPVVVLVHGGFWRFGWDRTLMTPLARDLTLRGVAAWNIEYRRVGQEGGGWPGTFEDVSAAVDHLATVESVDTSRAIVVGHSAGGHLALWLAARSRVPAGMPGTDPAVRLRGAVAQGAVSCLTSAAEENLGDGAAAKLVGGTPDEVPERFAAADPKRLLPLGVPQVLVHGGRDEPVPLWVARGYAAAAGDEVELVEFPDADHFDVIDPDHAAWRAVVERLPRLLG